MISNAIHEISNSMCTANMCVCTITVNVKPYIWYVCDSTNVLRRKEVTYELTNTYGNGMPTSTDIVTYHAYTFDTHTHTCRLYKQIHTRARTHTAIHLLVFAITLTAWRLHLIDMYVVYIRGKKTYLLKVQRSIICSVHLTRLMWHRAVLLCYLLNDVLLLLRRWPHEHTDTRSNMHIITFCQNAWKFCCVSFQFLRLRVVVISCFLALPLSLSLFECMTC